MYCLPDEADELAFTTSLTELVVGTVSMPFKGPMVGPYMTLLSVTS